MRPSCDRRSFVVDVEHERAADRWGARPRCGMRRRGRRTRPRTVPIPRATRRTRRRRAWLRSRRVCRGRVPGGASGAGGLRSRRACASTAPAAKRRDEQRGPADVEDRVVERNLFGQQAPGAGGRGLAFGNPQHAPRGRGRVERAPRGGPRPRQRRRRSRPPRCRRGLRARSRPASVSARASRAVWPCWACDREEARDARPRRRSPGPGRRESGSGRRADLGLPRSRNAWTAGCVSGAGSSPSADTSRCIPSATASASNAGPMFADEAGTRTTPTVSARASASHVRRVASIVDCHCPAQRDGYLQHMSERRARAIRTRQCARFGCSAIAVATYTFDSEARTVWLDVPLDGNARGRALPSARAIAHASARLAARGRRAGRSQPAPEPGTTSGAAAPSPSTRRRAAVRAAAGRLPSAGRSPTRRGSCPGRSSRPSCVVFSTRTVHFWRGLFGVPVPFDPV